MRRNVLLAMALLMFVSTSRADNWPAWRGPAGTGAGNETNLPTEWSAEENIAWETPLPGPGNSTPIVWRDRVFVTGAVDKGAKRTVMCFDRAGGDLLWTQAIEFDGEEPTHGDNPYCSASPVTDGERVIAWHGSAGVVAYNNFAGEELWRADLGKFEHIWGNASSPVLFEDLAILYCGPGPNTFLVALDKQTGSEVWRRDLPDAQGKDAEAWVGSWGTPVLQQVDGAAQLVIGLPKHVKAFDPRTGDEIWSCGGLSDLVYTNVLISPKTIVAMSGYMGPALAVRTGGAGDVTETHRLWLTETKNPQRIGSGVIVGDHIYLLNESGVAECMVAATGESVWKERLGGKSWSSMSYVDGKLYVPNMEGETFVLAAEPEFRLIAQNALGERTRASLAFSDGRIFIRTYEHLYCIGQRRSE